MQDDDVADELPRPAFEDPELDAPFAGTFELDISLEAFQDDEVTKEPSVICQTISPLVLK